MLQTMYIWCPLVEFKSFASLLYLEFCPWTESSENVQLFFGQTEKNSITCSHSIYNWIFMHANICQIFMHTNICQIFVHANMLSNWKCVVGPMGEVPACQTNRRWRHKFAPHTIFHHSSHNVIPCGNTSNIARALSHNTTIVCSWGWM